jgi:heme O synthase-like polyprenyltransferase
VLTLLPAGLLLQNQTQYSFIAALALTALAIAQGYFALQFFRIQNETTSRRLLLASLLYLPSTLPCICLAAWPVT